MNQAKLLCSLAAGALSLNATPGRCADVPDWLRAQVALPTPPHDEQANAIEVYSDVVLTVQSSGRMSRRERHAFRILRPDGQDVGLVKIEYDPLRKLDSLHAWSIPASGDPYAVKDREIADISMQAVDNSELLSDIRVKALQIPASVPGSVVGYEAVQELQLYQLADDWDFQSTIPAHEQHYTLVLPPGWTYQATWLNHAPVTPSVAGNNSWEWVVTDSKPIRIENSMPPWQGISAHLWLTFQPPTANAASLNSWQAIGVWQQSLAKDRRVASPAIKQKVAELTANEPTLEGKVRKLAEFVQMNVRYVAIELGIGGYQPHAATEVYTHLYGDCKDKSTLLSTMLNEIGVESHYVLINTERGAIDASTPAHLGFDHVILAIRVPPELDNTLLAPAVGASRVGKLLYFDPTDPYVPLGSLSGGLQANYGLVIEPEGGELLQLPQLASDLNAIRRTGSFTLDDKGTLAGKIHEVRSGDAAAEQRAELRNRFSDADIIRPIEALAAAAFTTSKVSAVTAQNLPTSSAPLNWDYSILADNYARFAGDLLLVRPRVIGSDYLNFWNPKQKRENPVEFDGPRHDIDEFEISVPQGFVVDELPAPVNLDLGSVAYHSRVDFSGQTLHYSRSYEIKNLSVPVEKLDELHRFYNAIFADERNTAVLKRVGS